MEASRSSNVSCYSVNCSICQVAQVEIIKKKLPYSPQPCLRSLMSIIRCVLPASQGSRRIHSDLSLFSHMGARLDFVFQYIPCSPLVPLPCRPRCLLVNTSHSFTVLERFMGTMFPHPQIFFWKENCVTSVGTI